MLGGKLGEQITAAFGTEKVSDLLNVPDDSVKPGCRMVSQLAAQLLKRHIKKIADFLCPKGGSVVNSASK
jgi:hypothetical protein